MVKINAARLLLFTLFSLFLIPSSARSQDMTPEGLKFWMSFTKAMEVSDDKEMKRLVRKQRDHVPAVFDSLITRLCAEDTPANVDNVRTLADVCDSALKSKRYTFRFQYIYNLSPAERYEIAVAGNNYYYGFVAMTEGKETKNVFKLDEAIQLLEKAQAEFDRLGDVEKYLELTMRIGECHDSLEDPYMACIYYQKYEDRKGEIPYGGINAEWVDHRLTFLKSKGYDPTLPRDEGGEPSPEALAGTEEGGEGTEEGGKLKFPTFEMGENAVNVNLKFAFMKGPDEFITPAFDSGYNPYTWLKVSFDAREAEAVRYIPFGLGWSREFGNAYPLDFYGKQVNLTVVKNKFYCDIAGNEKSRAVVKATTRPSRILLEDKENKGPDGKPYKYAFFVAAPGSQEGMFGMEMNNASTRMDWLIVRSRSASYTKGKVFNENFVVIDDNSTGSFGDAKLVESDFITPGEYSYWRTDAIVVGKEKIARPYSRYIKMGEKWINLNLDIYGQKLTASEVTVETGFVKLDWTGEMEPTYLVLHLVDANNPDVFFNVAGSKDPVEIPIGEYEIAWGKIEDKKKGQARQIRIYRGKAEYIQVIKGEEAVLALGAPFTFDFNTSATMDTFKVLGKSITVWGKSNELYTVFFDHVPQPLVSIREAESQKVVAKKQKMKMPIREDYFADPSSVWFPLDFIYKSKKGSKMEAMIEAKSVKYLGGPITSEWK